MKHKSELSRMDKIRLARMKVRKAIKKKRAVELRRKAVTSYDAKVLMYLEQSKLESKFKEVFKVALVGIKEHLETEVADDIRKRFTAELQNLREQGKLYKAEYRSFPLSAITMERINSLGAKGWKYVFDIEDKLIFMREYSATEE
jgi:hypothetical protein